MARLRTMHKTMRPQYIDYFCSCDGTSQTAKFAKYSENGATCGYRSMEAHIVYRDFADHTAVHYHLGTNGSANFVDRAHGIVPHLANTGGNGRTWTRR